MNTLRRTTVLLGIAAGFAASAQMPVLAQVGGDHSQKITGTWSLVSAVNTMPDGQKVDVFGSKPNGNVIFSPDGHFTVFFMRDGLPKFASGNRQKGTPEENQAIVQGSLAYSGTYSADAKDKVLVMNVDASTFPAWIGEVQKRKYTIEGDKLQWVGIVGTGGGNLLVTLKRAK